MFIWSLNLLALDGLVGSAEQTEILLWKFAHELGDLNKEYLENKV